MSRSTIKSTLTAALLCSLYVAAVPSQASPLYARFLFVPSTEISYQPDQIGGIAREDVSIDINGSKLSGWFFHNPASPYVVLISHGNGGNISSMRWITSNVLSTGASVLLYDYRGYGRSPGKPSVKSICADGDAAYNFLVNTKGYRSDQIILYGQSLGCAVASHIAAAHDALGLILQSGFSSLRTVAYERFPILKYSLSLLVPNVLDNAKLLSQMKIPLLIIHGDHDKIVPFDNAKMLYDAAVGQKELVVCHNSGHRLFPEAAEQHREAITKFINQLVASRRPQAEPTQVSAGATEISIP